MVGEGGFEPPTSCSQSRRANQAALLPGFGNLRNTSRGPPRAKIRSYAHGVTSDDVTSGHVLELAGIGVRFGGVVALDDVSFSVSSGEMLGLIGANGAGKTTLFDVVSGVRRPNEGVVRLYGSDVTSWSPQRRARRGLTRTFQRPQVFGWLTVEENVLVATEWRGGGGGVAGDLVRLPTRSRLERKRRNHIGEVLKRCGLEGDRDTQASTLPMGMIRMVELARALVDEPRLLLLDEPTSGLDVGESDRLAAVVEKVRSESGCAVLLVEHDIAFVMRHCERVLVLDLGRCIAEGTPDQVSRDPVVRTAYLGVGPTGVVQN